MWPSRASRLAEIKAGLGSFSASERVLAGLATPQALDTLAMQMIASLRRLDYTAALLKRPIDPKRADPRSEMFDPERAALFHAKNGNIDEAIWLIFLSVHFGRHAAHGWKRLRDVYSGLGHMLWTWERVSGDVTGFRDWLSANEDAIGGAFGNHRKYESMDGASDQGTGAVVASYVTWIGPARSHAQLFGRLIQASGNEPQIIFDAFYRDMSVHRFGRLGKFDFLALLGRLGLAPLVPGRAYLSGASGPLRGARLLFGGDPKASIRPDVLEGYLQELDEALQIGMQVMEDSLCNWQKSPLKFVHFKG